MHRTFRRLVPAAALVALSAAGGCRDFLTNSSELTSNPNQPTIATASQLFAGIQTGIWELLLGPMNWYAGMWTQQFLGSGIQFDPVYHYIIDESTTNGINTALYTTGGLVDVRKLESQAAASHDSLFLGIAQVQEALLIGTAADIFGDIEYNGALTGQKNIPLTPQLAVFDSAQALLSRAVVNMAATGVSNVGPGAADLSYGGNAAQWTKLAHTLKARFYLHTAEVRTGVYALALAEAQQGLTSTGDNFVAAFSGNANEQNIFYQFNTARAGYLIPNTAFVDTLQNRNDPRLSDYFNAQQTNLSAARLATNYTQPLITANENLLIWAESAQRTGDDGTARTQLNAERTIARLPSVAGSVAGNDLLTQILSEKYVSDFGSIEVWNDYKRTCYPNLTPSVEGAKIPARLYYDQAERLTNSNIPQPTQQPLRNANDPPNKYVDGSPNTPCLGQ
ncbi:MAG TPA: SusD/RagB family nutrient-binding outer membrane lipoprotein [Gemmatirosa sp.]